MGRAMLIIVTGLLIALGYTFVGMTNQRSMLAQQSSNSASKALTKNMAYTGVQFALKKFDNSTDHSWRGPDQVDLANGNVAISVEEVKPDQVIEVTSIAKTNSNTKNKLVANYDISKKEKLVPKFKSGLSIATQNFIFDLGGSAKIDGNHNTSDCNQAPGVSVINSQAKNEVGENSRIDGNPDDEAKVDSDLKFEDYKDLISMLADKPETEHISGNYKGDMGTKDDPGTFFIEEDTKLSGGISEGYGIMVIRKDADLDYEGDLDIRGNFTFNGLVIFENAYELDAKGTPKINGSVVVGSTNEEDITIDISGNVALNYDCNAQKYAKTAADKSINRDHIFQPMSIYQ